MPTQRIPKELQEQAKQRFREIVDWAFDGNLSMAARVLEMPFSTVRHYYEFGPRRVNHSAIQRMDSVLGRRVDQTLGLGRWLVGEEVKHPSTGTMVGVLTETTHWQNLRARQGNGYYPVPDVVEWRVLRIAKRMSTLSGNSDPDTQMDVFYAPILAALANGVLTSFHFLPAVPGGQPDWDKAATNLSEGVGQDVTRAKVVHRLCEFWEAMLDIGSP